MAAGIIAIISFFWGIIAGVNRIVHNTIRVRRVYKSNDRDWNDFSQLFEERIRFELREAPEDIGEWLDEYELEKKNDRNSYGEYLLVAKFRRRVIGFLFFEYSFKTNFMYIGFIGGEKNEGDTNYRSVTTSLVKGCHKILKKEISKCKLIIFEVDDENDQNLTDEQRQDAEAKKRLFGSQVLKKGIRKRGAKVYEICLDYFQLPLHRNQHKSIKQDLVIVPLNQNVVSEDMTISREYMKEIMDFLFFEVYDPLSEERYLGSEYHTTLTKYYEKFLESAPEKIKLKQLTRVRK